MEQLLIGFFALIGICTVFWAGYQLIKLAVESSFKAKKDHKLSFALYLGGTVLTGLGMLSVPLLEVVGFGPKSFTPAEELLPGAAFFTLIAVGLMRIFLSDHFKKQAKEATS
ncbi:hypothetical protein GOV04_02095 [Candidatus Woesearchaeota archaeon]|nr:hypothetical protein [Candidatus Woesearchaeota archaeon]